MQIHRKQYSAWLTQLLGVLFFQVSEVEFQSTTGTGLFFQAPKVRARINEEEVREVYIISLIEHKSQVDYDVAMQILRYMAVIWQDYARKQNEQREGASSRKNFRYPLIIPMVDYEGSRNWTAERNLASRIECSELAEQYVPDFEVKS